MMVLPEEDDRSSGTTKPKHHSPRRVVNLKVFFRGLERWNKEAGDAASTCNLRYSGVLFAPVSRSMGTIW
jgi:hypothetical protein